MTRNEASEYCHNELLKHGLKEWSVRLNTAADSRFLGLCSYKDKCIILSAHHIDIHPTADVVNTIKHEVAHALTPGCGHNETWADKAREIGCDNTSPCSNLSLSPDIIDAIRSSATVEVTFDTEVIRKPRYQITRLQDKCEYCGKVAVFTSENTISIADPNKPDLKIIKLECGHTIIKQIPKGTPFHTFQMGGNPDCKHDWDKNKCKSCGRFRPYDFQLDGMKFLEAGLSVNKGAAVFDEMGLGKTIQAEGVLKFHPEFWPVLWIVKSGLKWQFAKSIILWMGDEHVPQIIESSSDTLIPGLKHYIIGYDMLVQKVKTNKKTGKISKSGFDISKFDTRGIKCVVLDECQQIKNPDSSRTQMVRRIVKDRKVIPLSGTPWKNRGSELFPVFNMMDPIKFNSQEGFNRRWVHRYWEGNRLKEGGISDPQAFREYTKDICIRRERIEVMKELPLVNRMKLYIQLNELEQTTYDAEVSEFVKWYNDFILEGREDELNGMNILAKMARMRHIVALAKIPHTLEFVDEFIEETDRKLVIFVHHQDVGHIMFEEIKKKYGHEIPVVKITSAMDGFERNETCEQFNRAEKALMIASTLASGEGLNLQSCADCVMHERQWNPGNEEQAEGRFIRIGQTATSVNATYAEAEGSVDFHLDQINEGKRGAFHATMNKSEAPAWNETAFAKDLASKIVESFNKKRKADVKPVLQYKPKERTA